MKVSVVVTILNEEGSIQKLLVSLSKQSKKPDEIIIVDAGSTDDTISIINSFKSSSNLKLIVKKGTSRSKGRNLGVKLSKYEIIAMTDAGCTPQRDWLSKLTKPFVSGKNEVVAGFYKMVGDSYLQRAMIPYLGVMPDEVGDDFLPSTRSIAFRKSVWKKVHGFDEKLRDAAEDTLFNVKLLKNGVKIVVVKNAIVEWGMPKDIFEFGKKVFGYSKGDVLTKVIVHPSKGLWSHNIHTLTIFLRYLIGLALLSFVLFFELPSVYLLFCVLIYFAFSIFKFRNKHLDWRSGLFVIILQVTSDIAIMLGFIWGILEML